MFIQNIKGYLSKTFTPQLEESDDNDFEEKFEPLDVKKLPHLNTKEFEPIEQLPEGLMALLHAGNQFFYGYILGDKIYRFTGEPYNGIVSPYEFRRLTEYEEKNPTILSNHLGKYHE